MPETKPKQERRELKPDEIEALFNIYDIHKGNVSAMSVDKNCLFKDRNQISDYRDKHDFVGRYQQLSAKRTEKAKKEREEFVREGINEAVKKAREILDTKIGLTKLGVRVELEPTSKDIEIAWKILKTEAGEPTTIAKNENTNDDNTEVKEYLNNLKKLFDDAETTTAKNDEEEEVGTPPSC